MTIEVPAFPELDQGFPELAAETPDLRLETGAPVTAAATIGEAVAAGFGDGTVRVFRPDAPPVTIDAHTGPVLSLAPDGDCVVTGGDDGRFLRVSPGGEIEQIASFGTRWVDCVAAAQGLRACSSGRIAHVWGTGDAAPSQLEHPSTVGGLAFDTDGTRLAVAHYGGATVWDRDGQQWKATHLEWKGSHGDVTFSPDGTFLVTSMQETMLHGWRLHDKADMEMTGYPAKVKSFAWVGDAPHLVTSGAFETMCWPFDGEDGPMGREPLCVAHAGQLATVVEGLPGRSMVIVGFQYGSVMLGHLDLSKPPVFVQDPTGAEVTAIAVTSSQSHVFVGDANGSVLWTPMWDV